MQLTLSPAGDTTHLSLAPNLGSNLASFTSFIAHPNVSFKVFRILLSSPRMLSISSNICSQDWDFRPSSTDTLARKVRIFRNKLKDPEAFAIAITESKAAFLRALNSVRGNSENCKSCNSCKVSTQTTDDSTKMSYLCILTNFVLLLALTLLLNIKVSLVKFLLSKV